VIAAIHYDGRRTRTGGTGIAENELCQTHQQQNCQTTTAATVVLANRNVPYDTAFQSIAISLQHFFVAHSHNAFTVPAVPTECSANMHFQTSPVASWAATQSLLMPAVAFCGTVGEHVL
jgi:hypothetical protein